MNICGSHPSDVLMKYGTHPGLPEMHGHAICVITVEFCMKWDVTSRTCASLLLAVPFWFLTFSWPPCPSVVRLKGLGGGATGLRPPCTLPALHHGGTC